MKILVLFTTLFFPLILLSQNTFDYQFRNDLTFVERVALGESHFDKYGRQKGKGYKQFLRWKYWAQKSLDHNGFVISKGQSSQRIEKFNKEYMPSATRSLSLSPMTELGPTSSTVTSSHSSALGRLLSIAVAQGNSFDHIIVASDGGGVWETKTGGTSWSPIFETQANMDVMAVEISHADNTKYFAGLRESGISYSTNSGMSWSAATGIGNFESITQIKVHPTNANIIYALNDFPGKLYRSLDAGVTFSLLRDFGASLFDFEFKSSASDTMYLAGEGGIDITLDGGTTWMAASGPFSSMGAIMLAVSPADPSIIYAVQASEDGGLYGLFKSTDSGISYSLITDNSSGLNNLLGYSLDELGGQAPRDMDIIVSPTNINEVVVGGININKSTDGGLNWTQSTSWVVGGILPFVHADQDALYYVRRNGINRIFAANDGGIYYSDDAASSFTDITAGMGIRDFYRIDVSESTADWVQGGSQDNGTSVLRNDGNWYDWTGADGGSVLVDHSNHLNMWATQNGGTLNFTNNGGNTIESDLIPGEPTDFTFPLFQHPTDAATIFVGADDILYKSIDGGINWTTFPNFPLNFSLTYGEIASSDGNVIYVGSLDGKVSKTIDGGLSWTDISPLGIGDFARINWIAIHPTQSNRIAIALSGAENFAKIMESTDGGSLWSDITSNLPNIGAQSVVYEGDADDGIYLGMDPGLFFKDNNSSGQWSNVGASRGFPNTGVVDIEVAHNNLYIATYGRGLWKAALNSASTCGLSNISSIPTFACAGGMKTATITWTGNDASVTFHGGNGATPASISAATGNSTTFTYSPTAAFFSLSLVDTDEACTWSYSGTNSMNCTSTACETNGGSSCGNSGHPNIAGLYNNGTSATTYSHGENAMVGRTIFLCGGQNFCATWSK